MAKLAKRTPRFGAYLIDRRGDRSLGEISTRAKSRGYELSTSALSRYEKHGRMPTLEALAAIADAYRIDFADACSFVVAEISGREPPMMPALSEEAVALGVAFDGWGPDRRQAFLRVAGLLPTREGPPQSAARRPDLRATARGRLKSG